jgi:hypothetical protein
MASRELRVVATEARVGSVSIVDGHPAFEGGAEQVFAPMRRRMTDRKLVTILLDEGWSNGVLYLAPDEDR